MEQGNIIWAESPANRLDADLMKILNVTCPMHLILARDGRILQAGATIKKLLQKTKNKSLAFFDHFQVRRPRVAQSVSTLYEMAEGTVRLRMRDAAQTGLRGDFLRLDQYKVIFLNLSFGISVVDAVRRYNLTSSDFATTDLAIELLYLVEAKSAAMGLSRRLNMRLQGAIAIAEEQACTDTLTGIYNRRALEQLQEFYITSEQEFGLLQVDLDHFKQVNDSLGHAAGDHVLQTVAKILQQETKADDALIRAGGDEFIILLPGVMDPEVLRNISMRLIQRIEEPIPFAGQECCISASIGGVLSRWYAKVDLACMLADADVALYQVKRDGRAGFALYQSSTPG